VTFATPFAILILQLYGSFVPFELDDAARVDGASAVQGDSGARKNQNQIFRGFWMIPASENAVSLEKSTR